MHADPVVSDAAIASHGTLLAATYELISRVSSVLWPLLKCVVIREDRAEVEQSRTQSKEACRPDDLTGS